MASANLRLFCMLFVFAFCCITARAQMTWVTGSYPTVWEADADPLLANGDMLYLKHVHSTDGHLAIYYFFVRVAQSGNPDFIYRYLAYDWANNRATYYKGHEGEGVRFAEVVDGQFESITEKTWDRWDFSGKKDYGWAEESNTDMTKVVHAGWTVEMMSALCMYINNASTGSIVERETAFLFSDWTTQDGYHGSPLDGNSEAGTEAGGPDNTNDGSGGFSGGGDTGGGDTGGGSGDTTVVVDGGMFQDEFSQAIAQTMGYAENITTNGFDSIQLAEVDTNGPVVFFQGESEVEHTYEHLNRFYSALDTINTAVSLGRGSQAQDVRVPFEFVQDEYMEFSVPLGPSSDLGTLVGLFRMMFLFVIVIGVGLTCIKIFTRAFQ